MKAESSSTDVARSLRPRKKHKSDITDRDKDHYGQSSESKTSKPVKRIRKGKLAAFIDLPIDVLFEVFGHLKPFDLLKLSRMTKQFRSLLMYKSSKSAWKVALDQIADLPPCPPEMSEPAWVNLVFDPHCHFCSATNIRAVEWEMRVRICSKCLPQHTTETYVLETIPLETVHPYPLKALLPLRVGKRGLGGVLISDFEELSKQYNTIASQHARVKFIRERCKILSDIREHAKKCKVWADEQTFDRSEELQQLKDERCNAISKKLEELGYAQDLVSMSYPDSLDGHELVRKPQKLTERIWANIKDRLVTYMEGIRAGRLRREFEQLVWERKLKAIGVFRAWKNDHLPLLDVMPPGLDFCELSPIKEILEQPREVTVEESSFSEIIPAFPDLIAEWRQSLNVKLTQILQRDDRRYSSKNSLFERFMLDCSDDDVPYSNPAPRLLLDEATLPDQSRLAKTVYRCTKCADPNNHGYYTDVYTFDWSMDTSSDDMEPDFQTNGSNPLHHFESTPDQERDGQDDVYIPYVETKPCSLFYPKVLGHLCTMRKTPVWDFDNPTEPAAKLDGYKRRRLWSARRLSTDEQSGRCVEALVVLVGLDPETATAADMDTLDVWFACQNCPHSTSKKVGPRKSFAFSWRNAVEHYASYHHHGKQRVWKKIDSHRVSVREGCETPEQSSAVDSELQESRWLCVHCRDTPAEVEPTSIGAIMVHLDKKHENKKPKLNKDYYEDFTAVPALPSQRKIPLKVEENGEDKGKAKAITFL